MWRFYLEGGKVVDIDSDKNGKEIADELQAQPGGGYVYDHDKVIPVKRVIYGQHVTQDEVMRDVLIRRQGGFTGDGYSKP